MHITRVKRNLNLSVKSLTLHKLRSLLTMLGVVFGVASVIAMLAIGEGSKEHALAQIERLGTNNIIVHSRKPIESDQSATTQAGNRVLSYGIKYIDEVRIIETIPHVVRTVPIRRIPQLASLQDRRIKIDLIGTTPDWFELIRRDVIAGRILTETDEINQAPVIVLTEQLARRLLVRSSVVGEKIEVADRVFTVVGVVRSESREGEVGGTLDEGKDAFIPITTCRSSFGELIMDQSAGSMSREAIDLHQLIVEVSERDLVEEVAPIVRAMFERFHDSDRVDYEVSVPLELLRQAEETQAVWNWTLGSIAGISLLVGGIGIMNIMLASVTERTREIGIRRAIGAKRGQIMAQFLTEALMLSIVGGLFGLVLGAVVLPFAISQFSGFPTRVPFYAIVLSLGISVMVGVGFGLYPARRAAQMDPIEALRHE